jgi:YfiH family protein
MTSDFNDNFLQPSWPAPAWIKAFTTLRQSGIGLNPSLETQALAQDTAMLQQALAMPNHPIWLKQIHGNIVLEALSENTHKEADAIFTTAPNQVCVIRTADCLPILFTDEAGTEIAAIHAGWRGLASGIIALTRQKLKTPAHKILAWLGPGIGQEKFEIRKDVYDIFTSMNPMTQSAFQPISSEQWHADLFMLARMQLQELGINQIFGGDYCTYSDPERFFSYRRDGKMTGRIISLIWIDDSLTE